MSAADIEGNTVEGYAAGLASALRGPRRVREDLVAEARDSLTDAVEAYRESGLAPEDAARRAIAEFGSYREIVPEYQAELAVAQGRRTTLLIALALPILYLASSLLWAHTPWMGPDRAPSAAYERLTAGFDYLSLAGGVLAAVTLLGFGWGSRYVRDGVRLTLAVGCGALVFLVVHGIAGGAVFLWGLAQWPAARRWPPLWAGGLTMWLCFDYAALCAWRCLAAWRAQREALRRVGPRRVGA